MKHNDRTSDYAVATSIPVNVQPQTNSRIYLSPFGVTVCVARELSEVEQWLLEYAVMNYSFVLKRREVAEQCGCLMSQGVPLQVWAREIRRVYDVTILRTSLIVQLLESL